MFKLQRLEITGFKSFADYTEVVFTGDGITAVVGPNGCGKSNVSESIAWVLGEQRAKSLRGAEMKDVIFQGTSKRKPSGMAEVVLHLVRDETPIQQDDLGDIDDALGDIDDHTVTFDELENPSANLPENDAAVQAESAEGQQALAVAPARVKTKRHWRRANVALDFAPGEAVSVTRRLYLSGESEYLLNGKQCRLRDIQDLFSGTGLSGAHYALIEQGRIGQILSAKPSDRRSLIEEAAGISKFRTRQRAAEARLESAKTNLRRISDIVEEIDKQVNSLRRQASKTRRYKVLKEEFRELLKQVFAAEGRFLTQLVETLEKNLAEAVEQEQTLLREVSAKDEAFRAATQQTRELEENLSALRSQQAANTLQRDRAARDLIYKQEQTKDLQSRSDVLKGETETLEQRLKLVSVERERLESEEKEFRAEAEKEELALREAERKYQSKVNESREIEVELEKYRHELLTHSTAVERFAEIGRQLENSFERLNERTEGLKREGERAEENYAEHLAEKEKISQILAEIKAQHTGLLEKRRAAQSAVSEARQETQNREKELSKLRDEFSRLKNRLETLQELDAKRTVYAPNIQKIFSEQTKIGVKFLGTLADKFNVEAEAEKAVETIFGAYLQTVLVETEDEARKVAEYVRQNNVGRIAVLATGNGHAKNGKTKNISENEMSKFIGVSEDFAVFLKEIFPHEMSSQIVEDFDGNAFKNDQSYFTLSGDFVLGGKFFISGKAATNEKNQSLLAFKREIRELAAKRETSAEAVAQAEKILAEARRKLAEKESQVSEFQQVITKSEREILEREIQEKSLRQEIERAERHKKVVGEETNQIEREIAELLQKQSDSKANAKKAEQARQTAAEKVTEISEKLRAARQSNETESDSLNEKRTAAATSAERRRSAQNALRRVETEQKEIESRLARLNLEIEENQNKLDELNAAITELSARVENSAQEQTAEQSELNTAAANLKDAREKADAMAGELAELNKSSAETRNARAAVEVKKAEAITRLQNINENCAQELNQSLVEVVETVQVAEDFELSESRREVEELRQKIESFGAVNMLALEELSEAEDRFIFMTSQRQDIIDSISSAEEALDEIKQRSRERFREAFNRVNEYFKEFFLELFGGGRGEMVLLEAEDILESGIEIVAQPPGKRLQNILLLSGGEKAMTAIALVMAIFQYRPSPFCLLDEVDAPLDEANVGRFVNKIAAMSEKTQFIVITHNKRTMEAAKALYGVTMVEPGVSQVVSVRFE